MLLEVRLPIASLQLIARLALADSEWSNGGTPVETPDESDMDDDLGRGRDVGGSRGRLSMPATPAYGDDDDAASGSMVSSHLIDYILFLAR